MMTKWKYPESRNDPNDPGDYAYDKDMALERAHERHQKHGYPEWHERMIAEKKKVVERVMKGQKDG